VRLLTEGTEGTEQDQHGDTEGTDTDGMTQTMRLSRPAAARRGG